MVSGPAIATLIMFIVSNYFVNYPLSFPIFPWISLPYLGRRRFRIDLTTAPILVILILWAAQCLGPDEIRHGIVGTDGIKPYNIVILFFSLAYMVITLDITGILKLAAFWVSNKGGSNGRKLFLYLYLLSTVMGVFLGDNPLIVTVFLVYYTKVNELDPVAWMLSDFMAANIASMVLFVGSPSNVIICEGFQVNTAAFTAYTILPFLACSLASFIMLAIHFRSGEYIPRKFYVRGNLDVRVVLLDPVGACVGSTMLGLCLIVIIIVSQVFKVEVWMISLSFAFAHFVWDLGWDTYRYAIGRPMVLEAEHKKSDTDEEDYHIILRQLNTNATINKDELGLRTKPENAVSNGVTTTSAVPNTVPFDEPIQGITTVTFDERTNSVKPIDMPDEEIPTVTFDETHPSSQALSIQAHVGSRSDTTSHQNPGEDRLLFSISNLSIYLSSRFPIIYTALPRLPFALVPFVFCQFILLEGLSRQGWIDIFANWLVILTKREMFKTVWVVGSFGIIWGSLKFGGTDIGTTILFTKIVRAAASSYVPPSSGPEVNIQAFLQSAAIALAVTTVGPSSGVRLREKILTQNGMYSTVYRNKKFPPLGPFFIMLTVVGLAVISAEMAVLY